VQSVVDLALRADQHHLAAAVGIERRTEGLFDGGAVVRHEDLGAGEHRERLPGPEAAVVDEAGERTGATGVGNHHVGLEPPDLGERCEKGVLAARRAVDVEVALDQVIDGDLLLLPPGRDARRPEAPVVQRPHPDVVPGPPVGAPADRIAPVTRLGVVLDDDRLTRAAARGLGDGRERRHAGGARVEARPQHRPLEQRQLVQVLDRPEVLGGEAALVEQLVVKYGVAVGVTEHAAEQAGLEVAQRAGGRALGGAQVAQQRDRRSATRRLECWKQRLCQYRAVQIDHAACTLSRACVTLPFDQDDVALPCRC
jgi:hypothetical protein